MFYLQLFEDSDRQRYIDVPCSARAARSLAMAVSRGQAALLRGPVGCGKTLLARHVSSVAGRKEYPRLIVVQLGDQTDAKVEIIATYVVLIWFAL